MRSPSRADASVPRSHGTRAATPYRLVPERARWQKPVRLSRAAPPAGRAIRARLVTFQKPALRSFFPRKTAETTHLIWPQRGEESPCLLPPPLASRQSAQYRAVAHSATFVPPTGGRAATTARRVEIPPPSMNA